MAVLLSFLTTLPSSVVKDLHNSYPRIARGFEAFEDELYNSMGVLQLHGALDDHTPFSAEQFGGNTGAWDPCRQTCSWCTWGAHQSPKRMGPWGGGLGAMHTLGQQHHWGLVWRTIAGGVGKIGGVGTWYFFWRAIMGSHNNLLLPLWTRERRGGLCYARFDSNKFYERKKMPFKT